MASDLPRVSAQVDLQTWNLADMATATDDDQKDVDSKISKQILILLEVEALLIKT